MDNKLKIKCPYCIDGRAWEINYHYWTNPKDKPEKLEDVIDVRTCSYCQGKNEIRNF